MFKPLAISIIAFLAVAGACKNDDSAPQEAAPGTTRSESAKHAEAPSTEEPQPALRAPLPTPKKIDFVKLFQADKNAVVKLLGPPGKDEYGEDRYDFEDLHISIEYRDGVAARAFVASDTKTTKELMDWIGDPPKKKIYLDPATDTAPLPGMVWVSSKTLPATPLDAKKILGAKRASVESYLGDTDMQSNWRKDGYLVTVAYDKDSILRYLSVTFDPGIRPSEEPSQIRRWCNVPPKGDKVVIDGKKYVISLDTLSITFERRYL